MGSQCILNGNPQSKLNLYPNNDMSKAIVLCKDPVDILTLPVELLVYIISFLPTARDKVKLRYVSRTLRVVSETPSLWSEFPWPLYDGREEHSVMNVLNTCGDYIKLLAFPDHVPPTSLIEMLNHCNNVTQLSLPRGLPPVTELDSKELRLAVQHMEHLEKLEVQLSTDIKPLLQIGGLKELTVHVPKQHHSLCAPWVEEWMKKHCLPCNFNVVLEMFGAHYLETDLVEPLLRLVDAPLIGYTSYFKLYYNFEAPLNLFPNLPFYQLEIGQTVIQPIVSTSKFKIMNMEYDTFVLTDRVCNGKQHCKADSDLLTVSFSSPLLVNNSVASLECVTELTICPGDDSVDYLKQLATSCPNIQRLSVIWCSITANVIDGLRAIALHCLDLRGLNLLDGFLLDREGESLKESHISMWEILSEMKLTHLLLETCAVFGINADEQKLSYLFQKCSTLQALEIQNFGPCEFCTEAERIANWSLLSQLPALKYCRLSVQHSSVIQDVINSCKELKILSCFKFGFSKVDPLFSDCSCTLQQLSITEFTANIPDIFMETVSSHGGLVHVVLIVESVSNVGITSLVRNSPNLLTCFIATEDFVTDGQDTIKSLKFKLQHMFPHRKLFSVGRYNVTIMDTVELSDGQWNYISGTDLFPLWWRDFPLLWR